MKITIKREDLLNPLNQVIGAVERRQTIPILSNCLFHLEAGVLTLSATDMELAVHARVDAAFEGSYSTTLPARKLLDICKALPSDVLIELTLGDSVTTLALPNTRFSLACLAAADYPRIDASAPLARFQVPENQLKSLLADTAFSMAQHDVRYYLNGVLLEVSPDQLRLVSTDGHRLSMTDCLLTVPPDTPQTCIIPRKGVMELSRVLENREEPVLISLSKNHICFGMPALEFVTKCIDGQFPNYQRVIPVDSNQVLTLNRETLKQALTRISILSNEKYRGIRFKVSPGRLRIQANNPDKEEAEEDIDIDYQGPEMEIGFNVTYIIDVLSVLSSETILIKLKNSDSSCIISDAQDSKRLFVVMPMRL